MGGRTPGLPSPPPAKATFCERQAASATSATDADIFVNFADFIVLFLSCGLFWPGLCCLFSSFLEPASGKGHWPYLLLNEKLPTITVLGSLLSLLSPHSTERTRQKLFVPEISAYGHDLKLDGLGLGKAVL